MNTLSEKLLQLNTNLGTMNTEVGNQADLIAQIKSVISGNLIEGGGGGATAYQVSSVDELPSDAVDGSLAIVESDSIVGKWEFHNEINVPEITCGVMFSIGDNRVFDTLYCNGEDVNYELLVANNGKHFGVGCLTAYSENDDGSAYEWRHTPEFPCREISIYAEPNDTIFKQFLKQSATRLSGGYSLYTRENGSWIYKCEIT